MTGGGGRKPPTGLGAAGRALWRSVVDDLPPDWEFDGRELQVLDAAARQADAVAALDAAIKRDGTMIKGAAGQRRLNGAVAEARQGRLALARLLGDLEIPTSTALPRSAASNRAARAAHARWAREHEEIYGGGNGAA